MSSFVPKPLVLSKALFLQIESEGEGGYPNEICGILIGREVGDVRIVDRLVKGRNVFEADEQYHRFSIDPLEQLKAEKAAAAEGRLVLGFYHSHPDHPARPSEYDREHAWPFYSYVIVAIEKGKAAAMTSWELEEESRQFAKQEIRRE